MFFIQVLSGSGIRVYIVIHYRTCAYVRTSYTVRPLDVSVHSRYYLVLTVITVSTVRKIVSVRTSYDCRIRDQDKAGIKNLQKTAILVGKSKKNVEK
jgi:hypothetical protein